MAVAKEKVEKLPLDKSAKFRTLAERRVSNLLKVIGHIGNLSNRASYEYSDKQIATMFRSIRNELDAAEQRFASAGKSASSKQFRFE